MIDRISKILFNGMIGLLIILLVIGLLLFAYYNPFFPLFLVIMGGLGILMNYLGWDVI